MLKRTAQIVVLVPLDTDIHPFVLLSASTPHF